MAEGIEGSDNELIGENLGTEKLHLLPNDIFLPDEEAKKEAPAALENVPFYKLEQFLKLVPLLERYGDIKEYRALGIPGQGQESVVFRVKMPGTEFVVKLFKGAGLSSKDASHLAEGLVDPNPPILQYMADRVNEYITKRLWLKNDQNILGL